MHIKEKMLREMLEREYRYATNRIYDQSGAIDNGCSYWRGRKDAVNEVVRHLNCEPLERNLEREAEKVASSAINIIVEKLKRIA